MSQVKQTLIKVFYLKCWNFFQNVILEIEKKNFIWKTENVPKFNEKKVSTFSSIERHNTFIGEAFF